MYTPVRKEISLEFGRPSKRIESGQAAQDTSEFSQKQQHPGRRAELAMNRDFTGLRAATGEIHRNALGIWLLPGSSTSYGRSWGGGYQPETLAHILTHTGSAFYAACIRYSCIS